MASDAAARFASSEDRQIMTADSVIILRQLGCRFTGIYVADHGHHHRRIVAFNHGDQCQVLMKRSFWLMPWRLHRSVAPFERMTADEFNDLLGS